MIKYEKVEKLKNVSQHGSNGFPAQLKSFEVMELCTTHWNQSIYWYLPIALNRHS